MSKYYKCKDVIRKRAEDLADTSYWEYGNPKNVDEWIEVAEMEFADLPTIQSEEVVCKFDEDQMKEIINTALEEVIVRCENCIYYNKKELGFRKCTQRWSR